MADFKIIHRANTTTVYGNYRSEDFFPLGIVVEFKNGFLEIPSRINEHFKLYKSDLERITRGKKELYELLCRGLFSENLLCDFIANKTFPVYHLLEDEKFVVSKILEHRVSGKLLKEYGNNALEKDYRQYTLEITNVFDRHIRQGYLTELRELFIYSADKDDEKELFRLTDFLIHFINWNNPFYYYYETSFDVIPGPLRKVENKLSAELRRRIKAYLTYHSHINNLKRLLEKREQGRISVLSVLDWKTDIKQLLFNQFESFFGEKKAEEYICSLEGIIEAELHSA
ncbi:MAG: hypothetical protein JXB00_02265 [Bacteroidales bacterium]|nr:hypothetical protein [Bacteroidales bacterium]